jgi:hypothetical protein
MSRMLEFPFADGEELPRIPIVLSINRSYALRGNAVWTLCVE